MKDAMISAPSDRYRHPLNRQTSMLRAGATAVLLLLSNASTFAVPFGTTTIVTNVFAANCSDVILASIPFAVSAAANVYVEGRASISLGPQITIYVKVLSADGVSLLGVSSSATMYFAPNPTLDSTSEIQIAVSGVVHSGSTPLDSTAAALTLAPGTYQAQLMYRLQGSCSLHSTIPDAELSVLTLSAVFDRIFEDGFS